MTVTTLDPQGWSVERIDSAIQRRMNAAKEVAANPSADAQELAKLNSELDRLLDARKSPVSAETSAPNRIVVEGVEYVVPDKFTMGELADIEEAVGDELNEKSKMRTTVAFVWITLRRKDPSWTLARVRDLDMDALIEPGVDAGPPVGLPGA